MTELKYHKELSAELKEETREIAKGGITPEELADYLLGEAGAKGLTRVLHGPARVAVTALDRFNANDTDENMMEAARQGSELIQSLVNQGVKLDTSDAYMVKLLYALSDASFRHPVREIREGGGIAS